MKKISSAELAAILTGNPDYVLELYVLTEEKLCVKPVYKFMDAFIGDTSIPEFCMVYCEADDPEEIYISLNSNKFDNIPQKYNPCKIIYHGELGDVESYYRDCRGAQCAPAEKFKGGKPLAVCP